MSYRKKLVLWMLAKHQLLKKQFGLVPDYFTPEDEDAIWSWTESQAEWIWRQIGENISKGHYGLYAETCPFCLRHENPDDKYDLDCDSCEYGQNHGKCFDEGSDWRRFPRKDEVPSLDWLRDTYAKIIDGEEVIEDETK